MDNIVPFNRRPQKVTFKSQKQITRENRNRRIEVLNRFDELSVLPSLREKLQQLEQHIEAIRVRNT